MAKSPKQSVVGSVPSKWPYETEVKTRLFPCEINLADPPTAETLRKLYLMYVESMEKVVDRRQTAHAFFLTANSTVLAAAGILISKDFVKQEAAIVPVLSASIVGLILSMIWQKLNRHYGLINEAKFVVIHAFEEKMVACPYKAEWFVMGEGKDIKRYQPMSSIETYIPILFLFIYICMSVAAVALLANLYR